MLHVQPSLPAQQQTENALLAATSLFLLSKDKLKQPWLRTSDLYDLGRNLAPARSEDKLHATREFKHREHHLETLVELARQSATGRKLLECLHTIAGESKNGDGKYVRPNRANIKRERSGEKTALQDKLLTTKAKRMVNALHAQFYMDPLSDALLLVLQTCDRLLVHWYQQSQIHLAKQERPESAFLDMARRNMMINVLVTYGLAKLIVEVNAPDASENIHAVMGAALRKLNTSTRFESLLRRSQFPMSEGLKKFALHCESNQLRRDATMKRLERQGVDAHHHGNIWRWLSQVQRALGVPDIMQSYFEGAALDSGELATFAADLKCVDSLCVCNWVIAATDKIITDLYGGKLKAAVQDYSALLVAKDKAIWLNDEALREMMDGFE